MSPDPIEPHDLAPETDPSGDERSSIKRPDVWFGGLHQDVQEDGRPEDPQAVRQLVEASIASARRIQAALGNSTAISRGQLPPLDESFKHGERSAQSWAELEAARARTGIESVPPDRRA